MKNIYTLLYIISISPVAISQTADFSFQSTNGLYCSPSTIRFTQNATGNPTGYVWTFGNGSGSNSANPAATYTSQGTYPVKLIVIYKKKTLTIIKNVLVNPSVSASFTADRSELCMPGSVQFTANIDAPISTYEWDFGNSSSPVTTTGSVINHNFPEYGTQLVSLKATAPTGCYGEASSTISIQKPSIDGTVSIARGCIPATVNFNATVGLLPATSVSSYTWQFADGITQTSTVSHASHNYQATGNFIPKLKVITNEGCSSEYSFEELAFGTPPTNHVAYPKKTVVCGSEFSSFVSKATNANKYFWDFGEGDTTSVTDTLMQHKFKTLGTKNITVTPLFNDCPGTPLSFSINVIGVIAGYTYSNTCTNTKRFAFINTTQGNQSAVTWQTGDATPSLYTTNIIHSYPDTGTFITRLDIRDNITGCVDSIKTNIYTAEPSLVNPDNSICKNTNTTFHIPHNYNNPNALYNWQVTGLQVSNDSSTLLINANVLGHFNNNFVIINNGPQYCPDTVKLGNSIIVRGPQLEFTAPSEICLAKPYNVLNLSKPYIPSDVINKWTWDYKTGDTVNVFQPQAYYFPYWNLLQKVKLTALDINGCIDTLVKNVRVYDIPFLRSIPDIDTLCAGTSSTLIAFHNDPISWYPSASISCTTCDTVRVSPAETTTYFVNATNRFGCVVTDSILINVYPSFTAVAKKKDNYICANESVGLEIEPGMKKISWNPTTGLSDSTSFKPIASPSHSTVYKATVTDSVGCFSSSTLVNVYVKTLPTVDAGENKTCSYNASYAFTPVYSSNVSSYAWTPATLLNCSNCANPVAVASHSQTYTLTVTSDSGCVSKAEVSIFVECKNANLLLPTAFTPNSDKLNDYFYPLTRGIQRIQHFYIFGREGKLIFESTNMMVNNPASGWDGTYKGIPQSATTYIYSLEAICETGETIYKKGSFVLIR